MSKCVSSCFVVCVAHICNPVVSEFTWRCQCVVTLMKGQGHLVVTKDFQAGVIVLTFIVIEIQSRLFND